MAKTSGNFDLTSQSWIFYAAIIFSILYGLRLFRMAKGKVTGNENQGRKSKRELKKAQPEPDVIPEEESGDSGNAQKGENDDDQEGAELLPKDEPDRDEETSAEEKKSK